MLTLDHVGFAGRIIGDFLPTFERLGFSVTEPRELHALDAEGKPRPLGQTSAHIVFSGTYIELSAVPDSLTGNHLEPFLARYEGLHILALTGGGVGEQHDRIAKANYPVTAPSRAARDINYGERHGRAHFEWFMLEPSATPEGLVCVVQNFTPDLVFQTAVQTHANSAVDLAGVMICSANPEADAARYAELCDSQNTQVDATLRLGDSRITWMTASELERKFPGFSPPAVPALIGLDISVNNLAQTRRVFEDNGVDYRNDDASLITILPAPVNGILRFRSVDVQSNG